MRLFESFKANLKESVDGYTAEQYLRELYDLYCNDSMEDEFWNDLFNLAMPDCDAIEEWYNKSKADFNESCGKKDLKEWDDVWSVNGYDSVFEQCYCSPYDRTFIMKWDKEGNNGTRAEVTGWYQGPPDQSGLETFKEKPIGHFDEPMAPAYTEEEIETSLNEGCSKDKELEEAPNPENEEKNKIIRNALKGPKNYTKNLKDLKKMGINTYDTGRNEPESGDTIYLHGPNEKHVSVNPDGTNVWRASNYDGGSFKKELDYKSRHSNHYTKGMAKDFNSDGAKAFDYYNYLTKPNNDYQDEVDQANKIKDYNDYEGKKGYNLPDEALLPEEKSLNQKTRKYVGLKQKQADLEDELEGYTEKFNDLNKVKRDIKKLTGKKK